MKRTTATKPRRRRVEYSTDIIERVTVTGPMDRREKVVGELFADGFAIKFQGPKAIEPGHVDPDTFVVVAEREHECER